MHKHASLDALNSCFAHLSPSKDQEAFSASYTNLDIRNPSRLGDRRERGLEEEQRQVRCGKRDVRGAVRSAPPGIVLRRRLSQLRYFFGESASRRLARRQAKARAHGEGARLSKD